MTQNARHLQKMPSICWAFNACNTPLSCYFPTVRRRRSKKHLCELSVYVNELRRGWFNKHHGCAERCGWNASKVCLWRAKASRCKSTVRPTTEGWGAKNRGERGWLVCAAKITNKVCWIIFRGSFNLHATRSARFSGLFVRGAEPRGREEGRGTLER